MYFNPKKRIGLIFLSFLIVPHILWAASKTSIVKKGNDYYLKGEFDHSIQNYQEALKKDSESDIINFNLGTALYKKGSYDESLTYLRKALLSEDETLKEKAFYNLGSSLYKSGIAQEDKNIDRAIEMLSESLTHLDSAISLAPQDEDAKANKEFVKKELERLKKKKEEQKNQQSQSQSQGSSSKQNQSEKNKSEHQQSQQNQDQSQTEEQQNSENKNQSNSESQQQNQHKADTQEKSQENQSAAEKKEDESRSSKESPGQEQLPEQTGAGKENKDVNGRNAHENNSQQSQILGQALPEMDARELTDQESKMLLENYEQNEAPSGMYQMKLRQPSSQAVDKDW